jgi:hypothetical protein
MRHFRLDPQALHWREIKGELLVVDVRNSRYLSVNRTGAVLWPLLARGATQPELADALCERWPVERAQAERDARGLVGWLEDQRLLLAEET